MLSVEYTYLNDFEQTSMEIKTHELSGLFS